VRQLHRAAEILVPAAVFRGVHGGRAVPALSRPGRGAVVCFGALQRLTFLVVGFFTVLGRSVLDGRACVVARLLRLTARTDRTRTRDARRPDPASGALTTR